jgi:hypothetical protein
MSYTQDELVNLSETELSAIAGELGFDFPVDTSTKAEMITSILSTQADEVVAAVAPAPKKRAPVKKTADPVVEAKPVAKKERRFKILVHNQDGVDASKFVKVQANGIMYAIPRETEVEVPEIVMNILNDSVIDRLDYENGKLTTKSGRRFPYTVLGEVK